MTKAEFLACESGRSFTALMRLTGLRLGEACRLKTADVDFHSYKIYIRDAKGGRHRETVLSRTLAPELKNYLAAPANGFSLQAAQAMKPVRSFRYRKAPM